MESASRGLRLWRRLAITMSLNHSSDRYKAQRLREGGKFVCDSCGGEFPLFHMRKQQSEYGGGANRWSTVYVGAMCCYEPEGGTLQRDLRLAYARRMAAEGARRELMPPSHDGVTYYGSNYWESDSYLVSFLPFPIILTRGGAAVAVAMTGIGFTSADTWTYPSGITDSIPSVLNSSVLRTSTVVASALMSAGRYKLTFNGSVWPAAFDVR